MIQTKFYNLLSVFNFNTTAGFICFNNKKKTIYQFDWGNIALIEKK